MSTPSHDMDDRQPTQTLFDAFSEEVQTNEMLVVRSVPKVVFEQIDKDSDQAGGPHELPPDYIDAIGRTMFDVPSSEDNTVTVLLPRDDIAQAPSQSLIRIKSVPDNRTYLGIVVKGPFAEPDGLRGDTPIMITTAVRGGIFIPHFHG